jgi:serine/threonine protein kinase
MLKNLGYSYKCDIFSIGSLMYTMLAGKHLFEGDDDDDGYIIQ